ncbi:MAG: MFS transporter [Candidatus Binatia bacterium]|nr:MFS transporter [Candidatus Binatia bacterium]
MPTTRETGRGWADGRVVFGCLVCQIGMGVGGYIFPVFLKPIADELDWSRTVYSLAHPLMSTSVALVAPLVGRFADRRGPRPVLVVGGLLMSLALLGAGEMQRPEHFYAVAIVLGVAVACLGDLPTGAAIAGRFDSRRGLALGMVYIGSSIGGSLGPLLATALAAGASWRAGFTGVGSLLWIVLLPAAFLVGPSRRGPAADAVGDVAATRWTARDLARTPDFWLLFWAIFVFYVYRLGVNAHLVAYLSDLGYSDGLAAAGFSLMVGVGVTGKLMAGSFADRVGARAAVLVNFGLIVVASILLLLPGIGTILGVFLVVHGFATAAEDVVIPLVVARRFGSESLATVYGFLMLALVPGGSLGPVLAGWIHDTLGSYTVAFSLFAAGNLTAVVALAAIRSGDDTEQENLS